MSGDSRPIAVIGAGFSGTITARHLLDRLGERNILLCERGPTFGRGPAYSTNDPVHLLNVRAENMSAFSAEPGHFSSWLRQVPELPARHVHDTPVGTFVSRTLYGQYLTSLIQDALSDEEGARRFRIVPDEVVGLERASPDGFTLRLGSGRKHAVAGAVLAIGNLNDAHPPKAGLVVRDPWSVPFSEGLQPDLPVVVVGTGLSMVDIVMSLWSSGFSGPILAISRRGLLPHMHVLTSPWQPGSFDPLGEQPLSGKLRELRREVRGAAEAKVPWQSVVDALRPSTSAAWLRLTEEQQARFLRHLRPWWDVHRHRMAPPVGQQVQNLVRRGYLTVSAGQVRQIAEGEDMVDLSWTPRGSSSVQRIAAQRVIFATGTPPAAATKDTLLRSLLECGLVRLDRHGLGLAVTDDFALVDAKGQASDALWAVGPIMRGTFWECSAVPDIRRDAEKVAELVGRRFPRSAP